MRIKLISPILCAIVAVSLTPLMQAAPQRSHTEQSAVVTAYSDPDAPAKGMTETDFVISEDGLNREVIRVGAAPPPTHIIVLVDDSQAAERSVQFLRSATTAFIKHMSEQTPAPQIALMTFGERPTMRADFQPKADAAITAAGKMFATPGTGSYFLQALMDASKNLTKRQAKNPIIVAFVAESGPEFSSERREQVGAAMKSSGASLWTVVLQTGRMDQTPEGLERQAVLGDVVRDTGGFTRTVLSDQSIDEGFKSLGELLTSRYLVTYSRPEQLIPPKNLEVKSKRADVRVLAPRWVK